MIHSISYEPSLNTFMHADTIYEQLPPHDQECVQSYTRKKVEQLTLRGKTPHSSKYWPVRIEATLVLHHHQGPIERHEAAFALGAFKYRNQLERSIAVKHLITAMRTDESPTVRHESLEALGSRNTFCVRSISAAAHMCKINYLWPDFHDVEETAKEAFGNILKWLKTQHRYRSVAQELEQWITFPHLSILQGVLIGSLDEAWNIYKEHAPKEMIRTIS